MNTAQHADDTFLAMKVDQIDGLQSAKLTHSPSVQDGLRKSVRRRVSFVLLFVCVTILTIAFSLAGLSVAFPAAELVYEVEATVSPQAHADGDQGGSVADTVAAVPDDTRHNLEASIEAVAPQVAPPPASEMLPELGSVPVGTSLDFDVLFTDEYPARDTGLSCTDLPRQTDVARAARQCAVSCAQDKRCRYFWANVDGRCCLKAAYDTASTTRVVAGRNNGQFCKLISRGVVAASAGLPPPQVQHPKEGTTTSVVAPADAPTAPAKSGTSNGAQSHVAVIILGQVRSFLTPKVQNSQHYLITPLQDEFGVDNIHVYLCADPGHRAQLEAVRVGGAVPTVFEARSRTMFAHMTTCYQKTIEHARSLTPPLTIDWFVRSRFDNVFFEGVPPILGLAGDTIYARARRIGHGWKNIDNEQISYWMWGDVCGDRPGDFQCVYRDTKQADDTGKCMIMDDQFAYIPALFAPVPNPSLPPSLIPSSICDKTVHSLREDL